MNSRPWTIDEDEILKSNFSNKQTKDILCLLNDRSLSNVNRRAYILKLKKDPSHLSSLGENLKTSGKSFQYSKGHTPVNKGIPMASELKSRIAHTFFPKGNKPKNTKEKGSISIIADKRGMLYKHIKIEDSVWHLLHRVVWEESNGPIPKGYRIHFIDGDQMNCTIENLKCLSPQEAMELNRITKYPKELQEVIVLKNKLKSKLKNHGTK